MNKTKILIYGAGAIGSIFAGMLIKKGYDVTILARGNRFEELEKNGLIIKDVLSGKVFTSTVKLISSLNADDLYDYIIITVQNTQIDAILPLLSKNKSENIVFVVNNPLGYKKWIDAVGYERIIIGFPSAGGGRENGIVDYFIGKGIMKLFKATTFGELGGKKTERLTKLVNIFRRAGFSPDINNNMDAWQKTHVAVILPIGKALYKFNSDNYQLSKSFDTIKTMILATRELFKVLHSSNVKITPGKLNFFFLPVIIIAPVFMALFKTKIAEFGLSKHTIAAREEMK
jgi:2-dehydropantoate 2-reductase